MEGRTRGFYLLSVNKNALKIVEEMMDNKDEIGVDIFNLKNGTAIVDAGAKVSGGLKAGVYFSRACMGGLGDVSLWVGQRVEVDVFTDHPAIVCMGAQFCGWRISVGDYVGMGSGPARALALVEKKLYDDIKYKDEFDKAVIALETRKFPDEKVADFIAMKCGIDSKNLYILVAPTASIVGSIQISARVVETGIHKMHEMGFDLAKVVSGGGSAPIAPVAKNDLEAMGRTNDCILYGGRTQYFVNAEDSEIEKIIEDIPSCSSKDYGTPFLEIFEKCGRDFYKIDSKLFSPAEVVVSNIKTGSIFHAGGINEKILAKSLGI